MKHSAVGLQALRERVEVIIDNDGKSEIAKVAQDAVNVIAYLFIVLTFLGSKALRRNNFENLQQIQRIRREMFCLQPRILFSLRVCKYEPDHHF